MRLLTVSNLTTHFQNSHGVLKAVDGVDLHIDRGETVGIVGESGCGKSSLARSIIRLETPTSGSISYNGLELTTLSQREMRGIRRGFQMVFQDPFASLNPRHTIQEILGTPLKVHGIGSRLERVEAVRNILSVVGLPRDAAGKYPHQFSGGQRQRIGIARALVLEPELIICDEPVSALDLSIQAQILNLLVDLKEAQNLSYLFISHDLSLVRYFADRVLVMYLGKIVESGSSGEIWATPRHPYTRALLESAPDPARQRDVNRLSGELPNPHSPPKGCRFHPRCPRSSEICRNTEPELRIYSSNHAAACHHPHPAA